MSREPDMPPWLAFVGLVLGLLLTVGVIWYAEANDCKYDPITKIDCPEKPDEGP